MSRATSCRAREGCVRESRTLERCFRRVREVSAEKREDVVAQWVENLNFSGHSQFILPLANRLRSSMIRRRRPTVSNACGLLAGLRAVSARRGSVIRLVTKSGVLRDPRKGRVPVVHEVTSRVSRGAQESRIAAWTESGILTRGANFVGIVQCATCFRLVCFAQLCVTPKL